MSADANPNEGKFEQLLDAVRDWIAACDAVEKLPEEAYLEEGRIDELTCAIAARSAAAFVLRRWAESAA